MAKDTKFNLTIEINGKEVADTLQGVGRSIGQLNREIKNLTPGTEEFIKKSDELKKARDRYGEIKDEINQTNSSLEEQKGHFKAVFAGLISGDFKAVSAGLRGIQGGVMGVTKAALAFIATPIGAVIAVLGVVLGALYKYLTSTQEGMDAVTSVTRPLMAIFQTFIGVVQQLGKFLFDAFANPKKSAVEIYDFVKDKVIRVFEGYLKILIGVATLDFTKAKEGLSEVNAVAVEGINAIKDAASAIGDKFDEAYEKGKQMDELQKEFERKEIDMITWREKQNILLREQENIIKNQLLSTEERNKAISESERIAKDILARENEILDIQIKQLEIKQSLNDTSREDEKELQQLIAQRIRNQQGVLEVEKKSLGAVRQIHNESKAIAKAAADARKKEADEIQKESDAKIAIFRKGEQELDALIKEQQLERSNNLLSEHKKEEALIDQKYAKLREKFVVSERDKLELSAQQLQEREDQLEELEVQRDLEKQERKIERDAAFKEQLDEIAEENRLLDAELQFDRDEEAEKDDDRKALILLEKTRYLADQQLIIARDKELAEVGDVENAEELKTAIREKFGKRQAQIDDTFRKGKAAADEAAVKREQALNKERSTAYAQMFGDIADLLGKNTAAGKAAAVAQATMNTYQGITEVWTSKSVLPEPFATISRLASTGVVLASGLKSISSIKSTPIQTFFQGGHTGDKAIYYDEYGKVTGAVHEDEWVAPAFMTESPRYANTFKWLEKERLQGLGKGYFDGGSTSTEMPAFMDEPDTSETSTSSVLQMLVTILNKMLDDGVTTGPIIIGDDELQNIKKRTVIIENARESAKIK